MDFQFTILLGISTVLIQSTLGGLLRGVAYSAVSTPSVNFNYGRIASFSSPSIIANPSAAATYSTTRYTAYSLVPLTASVAAPTVVSSRQPVGGFVRSFAAPKHSGFSNSLLRHQGVTAYAAVPIAGYRAHFGGPSVRQYGTSFRNFPVDTVAVQSGLYLPPATSGFEDYTPPILSDQSNYGNFDNENSISIW